MLLKRQKWHGFRLDRVHDLCGIERKYKKLEIKYNQLLKEQEEMNHERD